MILPTIRDCSLSFRQARQDNLVAEMDKIFEPLLESEQTDNNFTFKHLLVLLKERSMFARNLDIELLQSLQGTLYDRGLKETFKGKAVYRVKLVIPSTSLLPHPFLTLHKKQSFAEVASTTATAETAPQASTKPTSSPTSTTLSSPGSLRIKAPRAGLLDHRTRQ